MKSIILAAGIGYRLQGLARNTPKCLLKLGKEPLLEKQIDVLSRCGIKDISVVVGVEGDCWGEENYNKIKAICKNVLFNECNVSKKRMYSLFKGINDIEKGPVLVIDGDLFFEKAVVDMILESDKENVFLAKEVLGSSVERKVVVGRGERVIRFGVKDLVKGKAYVNAGMMKIGEKLFEDLKKSALVLENHNKTVSSVLDSLCKKHNLNVITVKDKWVNLNTMGDFRRAIELSGKKRFAVIWDFDGVILDSGPLQTVAYKQAFLNQGVRIQDKDYSENTGRKDIFQRICRKYNANCDFDKWYKEKNNLYWGEINKGVKMIPGVDKLIRKIYDERCRIALVSSTSRNNLLFILNKLGIRDFFEEIIGFEDSVEGKPDPEPYLKAAEKLNIEPKNCIVIEDTSVGVESAKRAGMKCVAVTKTNRVKQDHSKADFVVGSLVELDIKKIREIVGA